MTCSEDIQVLYADLFQKMRNYIWDLDVVELLADVEVDTFDAFIDFEKLNKDYNKLYSIISTIAKNEGDVDMQEAADAFKKGVEDALNDECPAVFELVQVQETVSTPLDEEDEAIEEAEEEAEELPEKIEETEEELEEETEEEELQ